jgi:hypothetical protein
MIGWRRNDMRHRTSALAATNDGHTWELERKLRHRM